MLKKIIDATYQLINEKKKRKPLREFKKRFSQTSKQELVTGFKNNCSTPAIIAEIKLASPTKGKFTSKLSINERIKLYQQGGASAISVVTESKFFAGRMSLISQVKRFNLPVIMKDFIVDSYQIYEAKAYGANYILLIAKILSKEKLKFYINLSRDIGLKPIIEITSKKELDKVLSTSAKCIAVNARNLNTFKVDINRACRIGRQIPHDRLFLGFSGVRDKGDFKLYKNAGAKAVLIGTALMETDSPQQFLNYLSSPTKVKICGIQTVEAKEAAIEAGADFIGFLFVPTHKRYIPPDKAADILGKDKRFYQTVGVFADNPLREVITVALRLNLDFVQLHGNESPEYVRRVNQHIKVIKAIRLNNSMLKFGLDNYLDAFNADYFLLDRETKIHPPLPWNKLSHLSRKYPIILAGGLTPINVNQAVRLTNPIVVDVSSGVEKNGKKDASLIEQFIQATKRVEK